MEQREILFQIWDKEKKRMSKPLPVFHSFIQWSDGDIDMPTDFAISRNERFVFRQFIGLEDKNGSKIYEGDIVNMHVFTQELGHELGVTEGEEIFKGVIEMWQYGPGIETGKEDGSFYLVLVPGMIHEESFEILGNKFQNPKLLTP